MATRLPCSSIRSNYYGSQPGAFHVERPVIDNGRFVVDIADLDNVNCSHGDLVTKAAYVPSQCPATDIEYFNIWFHMSPHV